MKRDRMVGEMNTRAKGSRIERELVNEIQELGLNVRRVAMSGQLMGWKGDIRILWDKGDGPGRILQLEAKAKNKLPKWLKDTLDKDENDAVVYVEDRTKRKLVVIEWKLFKEFLK